MILSQRGPGKIRQSAEYMVTFLPSVDRNGRSSMG
jgi:hypothetical protein